jgi:hypothetical protein
MTLVNYMITLDNVQSTNIKWKFLSSNPNDKKPLKSPSRSEPQSAGEILSELMVLVDLDSLMSLN